MSDGDRKLLRALLFEASAAGVTPASLANDNPVPDSAPPASRYVVAAQYLHSHLGEWKKSKTQPELQAEVRAVIKPILDNLADADDASLPPAEASRNRWALAELLKIFDLFADRPLPGLDVEKAYDGAIDVLGIQRIRSAA